MPRRKIKADSHGRKKRTFPFSGRVHAHQHACFWNQSRSGSTPHCCTGQAASTTRPTALRCLPGSCPGSRTAQAGPSPPDRPIPARPWAPAASPPLGTWGSCRHTARVHLPGIPPEFGRTAHTSDCNPRSVSTPSFIRSETGKTTMNYK